MPGVTLTGKRERPDFICSRPDGSKVGVEVTIVTRYPEDAFAVSVLSDEQMMNAYEAVEKMMWQIGRKELKRASPGWLLPDSCILLLSVPDCPLPDMAPYFDPKDFDDTGFVEIWLADHTATEAFREVDIFCLKPAKYWGRHHNERGKPFG